MEEINGQRVMPVYNYYIIVIDKQNSIKSNFDNELEALVKKVKSSKKGIWLKIEESIYQKIDIKLLQLLQKEFTFYYNDKNDKCLIFVATKLKNYPPSPNTNIGTHLMIMTPDNNILTTIEDDGNGNTIVSLPGGHIDLDDNGIINALHRQFGEEVTKNIKINKKNLKLVTIRQVPLFPRLGNLYKNQDIWFLYKLELSKADCNKIIKNFEKNEEVKTLELMTLDELKTKVSWLSKDIVSALESSASNTIDIHHSKKAYNNSEGYFYY
jgi:hypothetical protein